MRPHVIVLRAALSTAASATVLHAAPATPVGQQTVPSQAILTKGTPIRLRLEMDLRSGRDKTGEPVLFTVDQNVYGPGHTLLLGKGALARGHVTESAGHGALGRAGKLTFTCDYARTDDGALVPLTLAVSPGTIRTISGSTGEIGASISTGARGYSYPPYSPYGYGGEYPGGYYQQAGVSGDVSADLGRVLAGGEDVTAARGQQYDAKVVADTPLAPAPPPTSPPTQLFTLKDKTQVVGALASFDGRNYTVETLAGRRSISAADVRSIQAISSVSVP